MTVEESLLDSDTAAGLRRAAAGVLEANWMGRFTRPAPGLYPHQWSWDSAFVAIGLAHHDPPRAHAELRSLFAAQWANGMVPHIVFDDSAAGYFPGPDEWQAHRSPHAPRVATSGIVQPPLHATAVRRVWETAPDHADAARFLGDMYPRLVAWHDYLYRERDPDGSGLVEIWHPWESGQDDSPAWDGPLRAVPCDAAGRIARTDLATVDADQRPTDVDYARYLHLLRALRAVGYEPRQARHGLAFRVHDVLFNTLLVQAETDLGFLAAQLGADPEPSRSRAAATAAAMNQRLWDAEHHTYACYDLVAGRPIHAHIAAGFTPLVAGVPSPARAAQLIARLESSCACPVAEGCWAVPSYDRRADGYSAARYWRGPVWVNINWLLVRGLERYDAAGFAGRIRRGVAELVRRVGFWEYYEPWQPRGLGGHPFSWTAALTLDLLISGSPGSTP